MPISNNQYNEIMTDIVFNISVNNIKKINNLFNIEKDIDPEQIIKLKDHIINKYIILINERHYSSYNREPDLRAISETVIEIYKLMNIQKIQPTIDEINNFIEKKLNNMIQKVNTYEELLLRSYNYINKYQYPELIERVISKIKNEDQTIINMINLVRIISENNI